MDKAGAMAANSDVGGSIKLLTDTTLALDKRYAKHCKALRPDCLWPTRWQSGKVRGLEAGNSLNLVDNHVCL